MNQFTPTSYTLQSVATGRSFQDEGWTLDDAQSNIPTLIRTCYATSQLSLKDESWGLYRFCDWLPVSRMLNGSAAPVTYKSQGLASALKLENLYITFNGYFPQIGANMSTCSFKETEAYSVCGRMSKENNRILVVASAGNTARAFAKVCSDNKIPLLLCVPEDNLNALWFEKELDPCVKLIASASGSDYFDAIHLSNVAVKDARFLAEGGAKNVARRDGMSTTVMSAVTTIGRIPDLYFQAVGSGTGAIAAWEANLRFLQDGRYGKHKMRLMVSQNAPFLPMYNAWKVNSRELLHFDDTQAREQVEEIDAKVLSNRRPPYSVVGGLYDALLDTAGEVLCIENDKARQAARFFEQHEGVDIHPAAAVAVASLIEYATSDVCNASDTIMLNITGGGEELFKKGKQLYYLPPSKVFGINPSDKEVLDYLATLWL